LREFRSRNRDGEKMVLSMQYGVDWHTLGMKSILRLTTISTTKNPLGYLSGTTTVVSKNYSVDAVS